MPLPRSRFAPSPSVPDHLPQRTPDDMGATLLRLLAKSQAADVLDVGDVMHAAGRLNVLAVDREGNHLLGAWMVQAAPHLSHQPDFPDLAALRRFDGWSGGQVWSQLNRDGKTALDLWIRAYNGNVQTYTAAQDEALAFLLGKTPTPLLQRWSTEQALGYAKASEKAWQGTSLVAYLTARSAEKSLAVLFDQGFSLLEDINHDPRRPVALLIRRPSLWQAFLAQGGDPTRSIAYQDRTMALWERLRDEGSSYDSDTTQQGLLHALRDQVQAWVTEHAGDALHARTMRDYWKGFHNAGRDRVKHMKSRPDWPTLQDEQGRSAMMLLTKAEPNGTKGFLSVDKSRKGAALSDHTGRTLWSYMLRHGDSEATSPTAQKWLAANVPIGPDHAGQGVVWQALLEEWEGRTGSLTTTAGKVLPTRWSSAVWAKTADRQDFWWGDDACQLALATWITDTLSMGTRLATKSSSFTSSNRLTEALAGVIDNTRLEGLNPYLLGALVAGELFEFGMDQAKIDRLNRLADAGALLRIPDDRRVHLTDRHQHTLPGGMVQVAPAVQAILGRLEGNELRAMPLNEDAPTPGRLRSRL